MSESSGRSEIESCGMKWWEISIIVIVLAIRKDQNRLVGEKKGVSSFDKQPIRVDKMNTFLVRKNTGQTVVVLLCVLRFVLVFFCR